MSPRRAGGAIDKVRLRRTGAAIAAMRPRRTGGAIAILICALVALTAPARASSPPNLGVRAAALIELGTGQQLYGLNPGQEVPIASTTKLMTALLTLEHVPLGAKFTAPPISLPSVASQIGLAPGETMTVHDLLLALLLPSADDAAQDLAYNVGHGSVSRFVAMMNARAVELGLSQTHYSTPIGLDTPGNYSSAHDLLQLARFLLLRYPVVAAMVSQQSALLTSGNHPRTVLNLNDLVGRVPWVDGVKTGHTLDAGYVLVGSGTRNGMKLVGVVLGAASPATRDASTLQLLQYGFSNFRLQTPVAAGSVVANPAVRGHPRSRAELIAARSLTRVFPTTARIWTQVQAPRTVSGPLRAHAVVGAAVVMADGRPVAHVPLLLAQALPAPPGGFAHSLVSEPFRLVLLVVGSLCVLGGLAVLLHVRMRGRRAAGSRAA